MIFPLFNVLENVRFQVLSKVTMHFGFWGVKYGNMVGVRVVSEEPIFSRSG